MRPSPLYKTKSNPLALKSKPPFSNESTFIWSNLAFVPDVDDDESNSTCTPAENNRRDYFNMHVTEEEMRIREELALEIEKELEREIMEGLLVLVRHLPSPPASQVLPVASDYVEEQLLHEYSDLES
ncbi:hypothetical protein GH714_020582 [Hevea brasiliensis]|uniref:Uncharacterized protein n=1 Tax=Hevea brasiliensis TaxID=3981 RepID=A0A6A6KRC6_HEVBR|nr:hypothetical protein GH714_020582 [Hevea brasiliensis]